MVFERTCKAMLTARIHVVFLASFAMLVAFAPGCVDENATPIPERQAYEPSEIEPLACVPNLDGKIESSELREAIGVPLTQRVSPAGGMPTVDLAGQIDSAGARRWDFSSDDASDQYLQVQAEAITGKWYASSFAQADFVIDADGSGRTENIYSRDEEALYLLGVASSEEDPEEGKTLIVYEQPVALYLFPLETGKSWVSVGTSRNAMVRGLPYAGKDTYSVKVEAVGELKLPDLTFEQAHMVRTEVLLEPAVGTSISQQQLSFLFECFGEVARVTSLSDEDEAFFTTAGEVRRLALDERGAQAAVDD